MTKRKKLSAFQIFSLCVMASMLGLFATGSGLSPAFFWLVILFFALRSASAALLSFAFRRSSAADFVVMTKELLTAQLSRAVIAALGLLLTIRGAVTLTYQTQTTELYLLEDTSGFAIMLVLLLTAFFALLPGIGRMSGVATVFTLILPVTLIFVIIFGLIGSDWGELRILYQLSAEEISGAFVPAALTAAGGECALFLFGSDLAEKGSAKGAVIAPAACAAVFALMMLVTVGTIGAGGLGSELFPFIEASRLITAGTIGLTGRFDFLLLFASLAASIIQLAVLTLCGAVALARAFGGSTGKFALGLLPVEFALAMLIRQTDAGAIINTVCAVGLTSFSLAVIPLLSLISLFRYRRRNTNE